VAEIAKTLGITPAAAAAILAGGGAILGSQSGAKPAGTTTTVQDIPDWQKPYVTKAFDAAGQTFDSINAPEVQKAAGALTGAGYQQMLDTINGKYLDPNSNPYLSDYLNIGTRNIKNSVDSMFGAANRVGSGANQDVLATKISDFQTPILYNNYNTERSRQNSNALAAPEWITSATNAAFAPINAYSNIVKSPMGTSTTQPYFTNPVGGAISGAIAANAIGNIKFGT